MSEATDVYKSLHCLKIMTTCARAVVGGSARKPQSDVPLSLLLNLAACEGENSRRSVGRDLRARILVRSDTLTDGDKQRSSVFHETLILS